MVKRDKILCTCNDKDISVKKNKFDSETTTGIKCRCFIGSETKSQKLGIFNDVKIQVQGVKAG